MSEQDQHLMTTNETDERPMTTDPTHAGAIRRAAEVLDRLLNYPGNPDHLAAQALAAALSGRVLGADEMHTEATAALFGGPDVKTPHMPQREGETYMDWCYRVAAVAVDAIKGALLGTDTPETCIEDQIESGEFTGKPQSVHEIFGDEHELVVQGHPSTHDRHGCGDPSCDC